MMTNKKKKANITFLWACWSQLLTKSNNSAANLNYPPLSKPRNNNPTNHSQSSYKFSGFENAPTKTNKKEN